MEMATQGPFEDIEKDVAKMKELLEANEGSSLGTDLRYLLRDLKSSKLRSSGITNAFCVAGGPQLLIKLLTHWACSEDASLILGLLGNLCALSKDCREIVSGRNLKSVCINPLYQYFFIFSFVFFV